MKSRWNPFFINDYRRHICSKWTVGALPVVIVLTIFSFAKAYTGAMIAIGIVPQTMGFVLWFIGVFCLIYSVCRVQLLTSFQYALIGRVPAIISILGSIVLYAVTFFPVLLIPFSVVCLFLRVSLSVFGFILLCAAAFVLHKRVCSRFWE